MWNETVGKRHTGVVYTVDTTVRVFCDLGVVVTQITEKVSSIVVVLFKIFASEISATASVQWR